jgi:pimeloyl-ACP methyl ester carboxylesterase
MNSLHLSRQRVGILVLAVLGVIAVLALALAATRADSAPTSQNAPAAKAGQTAKPTVVLVHGVWADSSAWSGVVRRLQRDGYTVRVFPNPLRSLPGDSEYLAGFLGTITGPIVLVGHSYGGAVITNAATGNANVKALVYINAFAPDEGETVYQLLALNPGSILAEDPATVFDFAPYPGAPPGDFDAYIKQSVFPSAFANDLPAKKAAVLAATQRPGTLSSGAQPSGPPAWKTIPSWYLVGNLDHVIPPATQRFMAQRAQAHTMEIAASHLSMISQPLKVTQIIEAAAHGVQ